MDLDEVNEALIGLIKGNARVLVSEGRIDWENMRRSHISEHDLREELRLNANVDDPAEVKLAVKERSGEIGVVLKPKGKIEVCDVSVEQGVQTVRIVVRGDDDAP